MSGIVTTEFRVNNAKQFVEQFSESEDNMYFFVGKFSTWYDETEVYDDNNAPPPSDMKSEMKDVWAEMIAMKKIGASDVSLALHRYNWSSGTVYDMYDDQDAYLHVKQWYMVTSQNQVFACMYNARVLTGGTYVGQGSTYEPYYDPLSPSVTMFNTPDGYTWKYMYTISPSDFLKFATPSWIPCTDVETPSLKSTGVYGVILTDFGAGYSAGDCTVTITGNGTGATATPTIVGGQITKITITNPGSGYTQATVTIGGTNTEAAAARAITLGLNGIGSRPAVELGAFFVLSSVSLQYGEGGVIPTYNEYRQFGIVRNPLLEDGTTTATGSIYNMIYRLKVTGTDVLSTDEQVSVNGGTAYVIQHDMSDPENIYLTLASSTVVISASDVITSGVKTATVVSVEDSPDLTPLSGDMLYIENVSPIYRSPDQQEQFVLAMEW